MSEQQQPAEQTEAANPTPVAPTEALADDGPSRADLIAGLKGLTEDAEPADAPAEEEAPAEEPEDTEASAEEEAPAEESKSEEPEEEPAEEEAESKDDNPALAKIQAAEEQSKRRIADERRKFEAERQQFQQQVAELEQMRQQYAQIEQLAQRGAHDPAAILEAFGWDLEQHGELAAKSIYARSAAGKNDPKTKATSMADLQMREMRQQLERQAQQLEAMRQEQMQAQQQQQAAETWNRFLGETTKAVTAEDAPLLAQMQKQRPEALSDTLAQATQYLLDYTGEVPDYADVVAHAEKMEREFLAARGIDVDALMKPSTKPTQNAQQSAAATKSLSNEQTPSTPPKANKPMTEEELRAKMIADIAAGRVE